MLFGEAVAKTWRRCEVCGRIGQTKVADGAEDDRQWVVELSEGLGKKKGAIN